MTNRRHEHDRAAGVREQVKPAQDLAEQRRRRARGRRRIGRLQHAEGRRRDEQPENHHPAEPDDERRQRDIPDREHPVIIIAAWIAAAARLRSCTACWIDRAILRS